MNFKLKSDSYWGKTPKKLRKIGDSMLVVSTFLATGGLFEMDALKEIYSPQQIKTFISVIMVVGVLGKFITNFFTEEETT
jgi:hypothetical protein